MIKDIESLNDSGERSFSEGHNDILPIQWLVPLSQTSMLKIWQKYGRYPYHKSIGCIKYV